jgi:hypothetical protein
MGNSKSHQLKEEYINKKFDILVKNKETVLGEHEIIKFRNFEKEFYIRKIINPQDYDRFADINEFVKNLSKTDKRICDFFFVEFNQKNTEMFDLIFEYGVPIETKFIDNEKELTILIKCVIKALFFLESNNMHYPLIHKNYIMNKSSKGYFKLTNPYCFKDYLKEVLEIYMNPLNNMKSKTEYCKKRILKNIKEFGKLLISLFNIFDEALLQSDDSYLFNCIEEIRKKNNSFLVKLILYIFDENKGPQTIKDLSQWYYQNKPKQNSMFQSLLTNLNFSSKEETKTVEQNKVSNSEFLEETDKGKKNLKIFDDDVKSKKNIRDKNILPSPIEVGIRMQKELSKDQKENFIQYKNKITELRKESEERKKSTNSSEEEDNVNFENIEDQFFKNNIDNMITNNFFPDQTVISEKLTGFNDIDFFDDNYSVGSKALTRKKSLNQQPLSFTQENNVEFFNQNMKAETSITSYLKTKEKRKSNSALKDLEGYYVNEVDPIQEEKNDVAFAKYINNEYKNDSKLIITNNQTAPEKTGLLDNSFKKKNEENKLNLINQPQMKPVPKNDFQAPLLSTRKIKKVVLKWIKEEGKYQKTIEYDDGSSELVEINDQENDNIKNSIQSYQRDPVNQNVTPVKTLTTPPPLPPSKTFNFLLFPSLLVPPMLLFTSNFPAHEEPYLKNLKTCVDDKKKTKPSRYHLVEEEGIELQFKKKEEVEKLSVAQPQNRHILKSYYEN